MDGRRGWPVRGLPGAANDKTIINRIMMLRFRPIAPKPAADGSVSDSTSAATKTEPVTQRRAKRKYVRVRKNGKCKKSDKQEENKDLLQFDGALFSLQTDASVGGTKVSTDVGASADGMRFEQRQQPVLTNFDNNDILSMGLTDQLDRAVAMSPVRVVESWVVVEGMAETLPEVGGIGGTDREKMLNLEMDTCPGLISDGMHRVRWVNLAYKRMVDPGGGGGGACGGEPPAEVVVELMMKEKVPTGWPMFACTVRVVYTWRKEKCTRTMACDVWKMDFGGFAWRLDSKTALCLGR